MEDLGRFMLDGLYFHQMRRVLPRSITVIRRNQLEVRKDLFTNSDLLNQLSDPDVQTERS